VACPLSCPNPLVRVTRLPRLGNNVRIGLSAMVIPAAGHKQSQSRRRLEMNRLPGASWRLWKRNRPTPRRRVHLGIDYGVSTSKIVFRNCDPSGGASCVLVLYNGSARIPSRVCATATALLFGHDHDTLPATACDSYESLKMRVAAEVTTNPAYRVDGTTKLPEGFSAADLAALTVWFFDLHGTPSRCSAVQGTHGRRRA